MFHFLKLEHITCSIFIATGLFAIFLAISWSNWSDKKRKSCRWGSGGKPISRFGFAAGGIFLILLGLSFLGKEQNMNLVLVSSVGFVLTGLIDSFLLRHQKERGLIARCPHCNKPLDFQMLYKKCPQCGQNNCEEPIE